MEAFHYKSCGLDNVYLLNGFDVRVLDGSKSVAIHDLEGLHRAIAAQLIEKPARLTGQELRFLRVEMDFSQKALGQLLGVTDQSIAKWEKGQTKKITKTADTLVRLLARECLLNRDGRVFEFVQEMSDLDQHVDGQRIELTETSKGWQPNSIAS